MPNKLTIDKSLMLKSCNKVPTVTIMLMFDVSRYKNSDK